MMGNDPRMSSTFQACTAPSDEPPCPLCGATGSCRDHFPRKGIVRCARCGLVYHPWQGETRSLYTEEYFKGDEYRDYLADERALRTNFRQRLAEVRRLKPSGALLEIGCAYGLFLDEARAFYDVHGIDVCEGPLDHACRALGLPVQRGEFLEMPDELNRYDVICLWDTIEHLREPVRVVERAARWLAPDGLLVVTTGNAASLVARLRGERWRLVHPPTHLFYFTPSTLERAVRRAGLVKVSVRHVAHHRRYRSMAHGLLMAGPRRHPKLYALATLFGRLDFTVGLDLGDLMMFVARKPREGTPGG